MNFNKNPFIGADKVATTNSLNHTTNNNINNIKESMLQTNLNMRKDQRELVKQKDEELKHQHEAFADKQRMFNQNNINHTSATNAQNNILRSFKNGH